MSRSERFDRSDFAARYARPDEALPESTTRRGSSHPAQPAEGRSQSASAARSPMRWPIAREHLQRVGDSVLADRDGHGRPHKGIDLFAPHGTPVRSAQSGRVLRVVDGRIGTRTSQHRAGLFIDVLGADALVCRYLHLEGARVRAGQWVNPGDVLGAIAAPYTSGCARLRICTSRSAWRMWGMAKRTMERRSIPWCSCRPCGRRAIET